MEFTEGITDHGQETGKLYHLRLWVECTLFCNLQSRAQTHAVFVIGVYELLGIPTTQLIEPTGTHSSVLSVSDEGYSRKASCALFFISTF